MFPNTRFVVYGMSGSGKSTFAATFPKPMLVLSHDPFGKEGPYLSKGIPQAIQYAEDFSPYRDVTKPNGDLSVRVTYWHDEFFERPTAWPRFMSYMNKLTPQTRVDWATIVLDSVTFAELAVRKYNQYALNPESREPRQWFAAATDRLEELLMLKLGAVHDTNVVVICHMSEVQDELNGGFVKRLKAPGRLGMSLPAAYSELYRAYVIQERNGTTLNRHYLLQTRPTHDYMASTSVIVNAPDPCEPRYSAVWANYVEPVAAEQKFMPPLTGEALLTQTVQPTINNGAPTQTSYESDSYETATTATTESGEGK